METADRIGKSKASRAFNSEEERPKRGVLYSGGKLGRFFEEVLGGLDNRLAYGIISWAVRCTGYLLEHYSFAFPVLTP